LRNVNIYNIPHFNNTDDVSVHNLMRLLRFSRRWRFKSRSSGLWHRVMW